MALLKGKHVVAEMDGVRCTVVETNAAGPRVAFLTEILRASGYDVKVEPEKGKDGALLGTHAVGVTDILFNPMIALYENRLRRPGGKPVSPACWNQWPEELWDLPYWSFQC